MRAYDVISKITYPSLKRRARGLAEGVAAFFEADIEGINPLAVVEEAKHHAEEQKREHFRKTDGCS